MRKSYVNLHQTAPTGSGGEDSIEKWRLEWIWHFHKNVLTLRKVFVIIDGKQTVTIQTAIRVLLQKEQISWKKN